MAGIKTDLYISPGNLEWLKAQKNSKSHTVNELIFRARIKEEYDKMQKPNPVK